MANQTPISCRNLVLYEVYVRNHSSAGTFAAVESDLARIRSMGVDIIWLMPIHPLGKLNKKGSLGCPYSIRDYRAVNPEYGTTEDFVRLTQRAHTLGLKVMIDVVFHHTAHDSNLVAEHLDWFRGLKDGRPLPVSADWSDVVALRPPTGELATYLIEALEYWAGMGVDGFRCDFASAIPLDFWLAARRAVADINPNMIWLAESVHANTILHRRAADLPAMTDSELYRAFDLTYDYDIHPLWQAAVRGVVPIRRYVEMLRFQDCVYPTDSVKLRFVENHDQPRIMTLARSRALALAWTAFQAFNKGALLIYAGQESAAERSPSLFDVDAIAWRDYELQPFLTTLSKLKKDRVMTEGQFVLLDAEPAILAAWYHGNERLLGIFNVNASNGDASIPLSDGSYEDLLNGVAVNVRAGKIRLPESAAVVRYRDEREMNPMSCELLDFSSIETR